MKAVEILDRLITDNHKFQTSFNPEFFISHQDSQNPLITLVTCSDSRIQLQSISQHPINQVFVVRNIGNQISTAAGSIDYGILHFKTPLLFIMGHSNCGAIHAFLAGYENEVNPIKEELNQLPLVVKENRQNIVESITSNVHFQVEAAIDRYQNLVEKGELTVAGAYYDFANGYGRGYGKLILLNINGEKRP